MSFESAKTGGMRVPLAESASPTEVARYWLTNSQARDRLNPQLAHLLRQFLEQRALSFEPEFKWCPVCGKPLSPFEQPDIWVQGLTCENKHEFAARGGHIGGSAGGERISLLGEYSEKALKSVIGGWLKPNPLLSSQLHASLRSVLEHYERA